MCNAILEFFTKDWILPNYNANTIILIPKTKDAYSMDMYKPIALANFKFKIISKILADKLASILPNIISKEKRVFIYERNIMDFTCLTSEAINNLDNNNKHVNLALKVDIAKVFDTINWEFLLKVIKSFGFSQKFYNWINTIINSTHLSINVNGVHHGYFNCKRGVRQGDPLSLILFCLAEDFLSRSITKLFYDGGLSLIKGSKNNLV